MTLTAAGDATAVDVGSTLVLTATPDETLNAQYYAIEWSVDDEAIGELTGTEGLTNTLTGVSADDVVITAEIKSVTYVNGTRTLVSLDDPITDDITIAVETAD